MCLSELESWHMSRLDEVSPQGSIWHAIVTPVSHKYVAYEQTAIRLTNVLIMLSSVPSARGEYVSTSVTVLAVTSSCVP